MKPISEFEFQANIKPIFDSIFINEDPFGAPFSNEMEFRSLLLNFHYGVMSPWTPFFKKAIKSLGEKSFYLSILSNQRPDPNFLSSHWLVELEEIEEYANKVYTFENAIYSINGKWGVICSHEDHALIGGEQNFINTIKAAAPNDEDTIKSFLRMWKHYYETNRINVEWIPYQLEHLFGADNAKSYILNSDLDWLLK